MSELLDLPKKRLKANSVSQLNSLLKSMCKKVQDSTGYFALYRGHLYQTNTPGVVQVDFLASDVRGNFKKPIMTYNTHDDTLSFDHMGEKFGFKDEQAICDAFRKFLVGVLGSSMPVSEIYWDFNHTDSLQHVYVRDDPKNPNEKILFMVVSKGNTLMYSFPEAASEGIVEEELAASW